jgi:hypothetical protein
MDPNVIRCAVDGWMELAQDHDQWQALALVVQNLCVMLPES